MRLLFAFIFIQIIIIIKITMIISINILIIFKIITIIQVNIITLFIIKEITCIYIIFQTINSKNLIPTLLNILGWFSNKILYKQLVIILFLHCSII